MQEALPIYVSPYSLVVHVTKFKDAGEDVEKRYKDAFNSAEEIVGTKLFISLEFL